MTSGFITGITRGFMIARFAFFPSIVMTINTTTRNRVMIKAGWIPAPGVVAVFTDIARWLDMVGMFSCRLYPIMTGITVIINTGMIKTCR